MAISSTAKALVVPLPAPRDAVQRLLDEGHSQDALMLLARLLPKRYAIGWVCQCMRGQALSDEDRAGASLAEKWMREPSEPNRRAAFEFANAGGYKSLGTWVAATAGWSGGSLAPAAQKTPVPPADHLTACASAAAINMLAALVPEKFEARRRSYVDSALELLGNASSTGGAS